MAKTLPCVLAIVGMNALFGLGAIIYYSIVFGLAYLTRNIALLPLIIIVAGLGGSWAMYKAFHRYVIYLMRAGHIAVMAELLQKGQLPAGTSQLNWGKDQVKNRVKETSVLFVVDTLVNGVVVKITDMVGGILNILPVDAVHQLTRALKAVVRTATSFIDEAILARAFIKRDENIFKVAQDGTILYAMAWKPILTNAAGLALFSWASLAIFLILALPVGFLVNAILPNTLLPVAVVIALAYLGKASLGDTFALATTIAAYHHETKDLVPSAEWDARLTQASDKFRELKNKAVDTMKGKTTTVETAKAPTVPVELPAIPEVPAASVSASLPPLPAAAVGVSA